MKKILFLCAAMTAAACFCGCNKDDSDDFDDSPGSIDLRRRYYYSLTPGETNDESLTPPVIEDEIITEYCLNSKTIRGYFFTAKAEKKGGYFVYQFFVSPKDKEEWIEIGKITEDEIKYLSDAYYDGTDEISFRGERFFQNQKLIEFEPETYYDIKIRANYILNGDTTFAESPTNTFFSYFKDNPLVYIQQCSKTSVTLAIDNSIYNNYDSIRITLTDNLSNEEINKTITKDVKSITFDNLRNNDFNSKVNAYFYVEIKLYGDYCHDYSATSKNGLEDSFAFFPHDEDDKILNYGTSLYDIKETAKFKYCIIKKGSYYFGNYYFEEYNILIPKKGWHFITEEEKEYFKTNYQYEYNQLVEKNKEDLGYREYTILVKNY